MMCQACQQDAARNVYANDQVRRVCRGCGHVRLISEFAGPAGQRRHDQFVWRRQVAPWLAGWGLVWLITMVLGWTG